jgi:hypothetical protein
MGRSTIYRYGPSINMNQSPNANYLALKLQVPCEGVLILPAGLSSPASSPAWFLHVLGSTMLHRALADRLITLSLTNRSLATIN